MKHPLGLTRRRIKRFIYGKEVIGQPHSGFSFGEIFSGAGGMALGFSLAGLTPQFLIDNDPASIATLEANFLRFAKWKIPRIGRYTRIQTFPDDWKFVGSLRSVYKQIGNAVPVLLAYHLGCAIVNYLERN